MISERIRGKKVCTIYPETAKNDHLPKRITGGYKIARVREGGGPLDINNQKYSLFSLPAPFHLTFPHWKPSF